MSSASSFKVAVPDETLTLLGRKLADARFPDELNDAGWDHGVPLSDMRRLANKWKDDYDRRAHEREINKLPMFMRDIEVEGFGVLNIHCVHQRSKVKGAFPLLLVHECAYISPFLFARGADGACA